MDEASADGTHQGDVVDPSQRQLVSIAIEPASAMLDSTDTMPMPTQSFRVIGTRRDGTQLALDTAQWSLEHDRIGLIGDDGVFSANGVAGGTVGIRAEVPITGGMLQASATITVRITRTIRGMGVPDDVADLFARSPTVMDSARAPVVLYPLDNALMPHNVAPPDVQWNVLGASGDIFRVRISKPSVTITAYVLNSGASFRYDWLVDAAAWRSVAESDREAPATIAVDRLDRSTNASMPQLIPGQSVQVRLAFGSIFGQVYYWDLANGRIRRINPVTAANENFMPNPPPRPSDNRRCVACHTISRDGRWLSAEMWGGSDPSAVFDLTADLSVDPAPTVFPVMASVRYLFSTFNPDATRLLTNNGNSFSLIDPRNGSSVAATGLASLTSVAHPEWSPTGRQVAFIINTNGPWAVDFDQGNLAVMDAGAGDTFGSPTVIHRGMSLSSAPEGGNADSHPTWSPDGRFIAFCHGNHSRSENQRTSSYYNGALYLIAASGGAAVRLDNANGGRSGTHSYWPTFSPFITAEPGGSANYAWLAFFSRRDYGNERAGTRGQNRRQLWVTAINLNAAPDSDPSHVPYWLPGQNVTTQNMAAFWAPQPCRMNGSECRTSDDCCSGHCNAMGRCEMPMACRREGQSCAASSDCCGGLSCMGNVCGAPPG